MLQEVGEGSSVLLVEDATTVVAEGAWLLEIVRGGLSSVTIQYETRIHGSQSRQTE